MPHHFVRTKLTTPQRFEASHANKHLLYSLPRVDFRFSFEETETSLYLESRKVEQAVDRGISLSQLQYVP